MSRAPLVCIDAGHGGHDPGAVAADGTREADVALKLAKLLARELGRQGAEVLLTRSDDTFVALSERAAKGAGTDCFVSMHVNSAVKSTVKGFATLASAQHPLSRALANYVQQSLKRALPGHTDDGILLSPSPSYERRLYVLAQQLAPAVIVEPAFLSNLDEKPWIASEGGVAAVAGAVARGVWQFLRSKIDGLPEWKDERPAAAVAEARPEPAPEPARDTFLAKLDADIAKAEARPEPAPEPAPRPSKGRR